MMVHSPDQMPLRIQYQKEPRIMINNLGTMVCCQLEANMKKQFQREKKSYYGITQGTKLIVMTSNQPISRTSLMVMKQDP